MTFPSFHYSLMERLCKELYTRITHFKVIDCLPHDLSRFFIILQNGTQKEALFFCFTPPFIRFHLSHLPTPLKGTPHPLLSFLKGATLNHVAILQRDRILQLTFSTLQGEVKLIAEFFSKHPNYYLIDSERKILFALHSSSQQHYQLPPLRPFSSPPPLWHSHQEVEQAYLIFEEQWKLNHAKKRLQTCLNKQIKSLQRKEQKLLNNLKACEEWSHVQHEGDLIKSHLASIKKGSSCVCVYDWIKEESYDLILDPQKTPQEEMAARYQRAKKLQAGKIPISQQLAHTQRKLHLLKEQEQKLLLTQTIEELAQFEKELPSSPQKLELLSPPSPIYQEYQSTQGIKIWVGKNAKANEKLTFHLANGRDWWLHVRDYPGSHVIIRMYKDQEPDMETLQDAFQLALYYSKARNQGEAEICFTKRKYVSRLGRKKAGLVQISKHQIAWIRFDPTRLQALKNRREDISRK